MPGVKLLLILSMTNIYDMVRQFRWAIQTVAKQSGKSRYDYVGCVDTVHFMKMHFRYSSEQLDEIWWAARDMNLVEADANGEPIYLRCKPFRGDAHEFDFVETLIAKGL